MNRGIRFGLLFSAPFWIAVAWFVTTDTAARMWSGFLHTWGLWLFIAVVVAICLWLERAGRKYKNARRVKAEAVQEARDLHNARTLAHIGVCGSVNGDLTCDRALRHAGMHADRHTSRTGNPVAWENYGDDFGGAA